MSCSGKRWLFSGGGGGQAAAAAAHSPPGAAHIRRLPRQPWRPAAPLTGPGRPAGLQILRAVPHAGASWAGAPCPLIRYGDWLQCGSQIGNRGPSRSSLLLSLLSQV